MLDEVVFAAVLMGLMTSFLWIPAVLIGVAIALNRRRREGELAPLSWFEPIALGVVILVSAGLLLFDVPCRIAFLISRSEFDAQVADAPRWPSGIPGVNRLGVYRVDQYAADPRGGTYFRTFVGSDGIGPDTMSYGFVKAPNREGSPFGAAHYRCGRMIGDWYWFMASDDWR